MSILGSSYISNLLCLVLLVCVAGANKSVSYLSALTIPRHPFVLGPHDVPRTRVGTIKRNTRSLWEI